MNIKTTEKGFTLVELSTVLVINSILVLTFATLLVANQNNSSIIGDNIDIHNDITVLDTFIKNNLQTALSDSIFIYTDESDESSDTRSDGGTILHSRDIDGNALIIKETGNRFAWDKNSNLVYPLTSSVSSLAFTRTTGFELDYYQITMTLSVNEEQLNYVRTFTPRN